MGAKDNRWKRLIDLGDKLLELSDVNDQKNILEEDFSALVGTEVSVTVFIASDQDSDQNLPIDDQSNGYREVMPVSKNNNDRLIAFPLSVKEEVFGKIEIRFKTEGTGSETEHSFLRLSVNYLAYILFISRGISTGIQLYEQTWISNVLQQISTAALENDNLVDVLEAITRIIPLMIDVNRCAVFLQREFHKDYILEAHYGYQKEDEGKLAMLPFTVEGADAIRTIENGARYQKLNSSLIKNLDPDRPDDESCCILISLSAHHQQFGILVVDINGNQDKAADLDNPFMEVIQSIGKQIALSIENFRLKEAREMEAYTTTVLLQSAEVLALAPSLKDALDSICSLLPFFIGVDTTIIYLMNQLHQTYILNAYQSLSWKTQSKNLPGQFRVNTFPGLERVLKESKPVIFNIEDIPPEDWLKINEHLIFERLDDSFYPESLLMIFPLHLQDELSGVMIIRETDEGFENRDKKIEILNGVARQISVAVQNEQLKDEIVDRERMHREMQFAQEIQRTFLPNKIDDVPGYEIQTVWRPARKLGGDFYDAFPLENNRHGFVIADVSDKGIPAALYMTVARTLIHASAKESKAPSTVLKNVNRLLLENSQEGLFITAIYGVLDLVEGVLTYTNAGHNQPIWYRKRTEEIHWLAKGGMPLGVSVDIDLENHQIRVETGDELVMYTDGVTECRSQSGNFFGEERLLNVLNAYKKNGQEKLIDAIEKKLLEFQGNEDPFDDVTIMTIKRID